MCTKQSNINMNETKSWPDARSPVKAFTQMLVDEGFLHDGINDYARDRHFRQFGFDFIKTEQDIERFLSSLDDAQSRHSGQLMKCHKAYRIRRSLSTPDEYNWGVVERFKLFASSARRVHCACHDIGCYYQIAPQ